MVLLFSSLVCVCVCVCELTFFLFTHITHKITQFQYTWPLVGGKDLHLTREAPLDNATNNLLLLGKPSANFWPPFVKPNGSILNPGSFLVAKPLVPFVTRFFSYLSFCFLNPYIDLICL